jgi:hypothetical protein
MLAVAAWLLPRMRADGLTGREAAAAVLIAVAAVATIGWDHRAHEAPGSVDLAVLGTVWLLMLVALSRPVRAWIGGALIVYAVHAALLIRAVGASPVSLAQLEAVGYILVASLTAFAALRPTMTGYADVAARRALLASRSAAERAAASAVLADRRRRLALLEMEVLPLLRGIAEGTLDHTAADVRERCASHAAALRHALTGRTPAAGDQAAGLEPVLQAAGARGMLVSVQVIGDPGTPAPQVGRAVSAAVDAVMSALPPHQVTLTVLAPGDDVEMYLTFSEPLQATPDLARFGRDVPAAARWRAAVSAGEASSGCQEQGCLEIGWRKDASPREAVPLDRRH